MAYQPIEDYGIIGDMHSVALVGKNGSIDWFCCPHFDSPSVFAAILDDKKGGRFQIAPTVPDVTQKQFYWPGTNVLVTRFLSPQGVAEITDYMPVGGPSKGNGGHQVVRRVKVVRGSLSFRLDCQPAFNYAQDTHTTEISARGACFRSRRLSLGLATRVRLKRNGTGASADFTLREDQTAVFVLQVVSKRASCGITLAEGEAEDLFRKTVEYWRRWLSKCKY